MRPGRGGGAGGEGVEVALMGGGTPSLWRTPTPYLFLAFAVMMGLIAVALLVLICTRRKTSSRQEADEKAAFGRVLVPLDREPKVVVIMAGEHAPSFLASAKPLAFVPAPAPRGAEADGAAAV
ncbi:protein GLUTAMINE DUMPER 5-like [Phragmites australis]|uniref:protein GLUTAMINE DUMPER 5-like n=1 Tax=Phragmites australis TaxID=29695 RepID=UPI002D769A24|nr:protein GLUTAMINE DUMPER 5-like [Phragmites australis]